MNYLEHVSLIFLIKQNIYEMGFLLILDSSWLSDTNCNIYNIHQNLEFCKYWNSASVSLISLACKIWNFNIGTQNLHGMYVWSISNFALKHNFLGKQTISLRRFLILSTGMLYSSLFFTVHSSFYIHLTCRLFNFFYCKVVFSICFYFFTLMPFQIGMSLKYFSSWLKMCVYVCVCVYVYIF